MKRVAILGGGISGLSSALFLAIKNPNIKVTLIEKSSSAGGWLRSIRKDGYLFELGSRSMSPKDANVTAVARLLHLCDADKELIYIPKDSEINRNKYLYYGGSIQRVSTNPIFVLLNPLTRSLIPGVINDVIKRSRRTHQQADDESIRDFFARRFNTQIADNIMSAFIYGVYGGDISRWSMMSQFKKVVDLERKYGSVALGSVLQQFVKSSSTPQLQQQQQQSKIAPLLKVLKNGTFFTFNDGMSVLPSKIMDKLKLLNNVEVMSNCTVNSIQADQEHVAVSTLCGYTEKFDHVISTLPAYALADILGSVQDQVLRDQLQSIEYCTFAPVNIVWRRRIELPLRPSIGVLFPYNAGLPVTGVIIDTFPFPHRQPANSTVMTVMVGGQHFSGTFGDSPQTADIINYALRFVRDKFKINIKPDIVECHINHQCMPQYHVGHLDKVQTIRQSIDSKFNGRMSITGASFDGIGIPDCINNAYNLSQKVTKQ
ncbi:hypothetical protein MP228_009680 [Amoeboaphelidium protococcarum]|nr:hypothetical protein MP228_009680 [Amoeboaphelidium protococcarum]